MKALAGQDITSYFPIPFVVACEGLVTDSQLQLNLVNATEFATAVHTSGALQSIPNTNLLDPQWYSKNFLPRMKEYRKGPLVWDKKMLRTTAQADDSL